MTTLLGKLGPCCDVAIGLELLTNGERVSFYGVETPVAESQYTPGSPDSLTAQ